MVQPEKVRRLLATLLDALADLRRYRERIDLATLRSDRDSQHLVLHAMYLAVQASLDIAAHAVADAGHAGAGTYQDAFRSLGKAGLIDEELAQRLAGWAGLRNVLAHFYSVVDYDRVHNALAHELSDLERFADVVSGWLEAAGDETAGPPRS